VRGGRDTLASIENVIGGAGNDSRLGNGLGNALAGGNGADTLDGGIGNDRLTGGLGSDSLIGGTGLDEFVFDTALGSTNLDRFSFTVVDDTILLDHAVFTGIGALGVLAAGAYRSGSAAADSDDRIIFNSATGELSFDADGNGAAAAVQFAIITTIVGSMTNADFQII
jgi:serralysin